MQSEQNVPYRSSKLQFSKGLLHTRGGLSNSAGLAQNRLESSPHARGSVLLHAEASYLAAVFPTLVGACPAPRRWLGRPRRLPHAWRGVWTVVSACLSTCTRCLLSEERTRRHEQGRLRSGCRRPRATRRRQPAVDVPPAESAHPFGQEDDRASPPSPSQGTERQEALVPDARITVPQSTDALAPAPATALARRSGAEHDACKVRERRRVDLQNSSSARVLPTRVGVCPRCTFPRHTLDGLPRTRGGLS